MSLANFMMSEPVLLRTGKNAPINLYQKNVILCPDKKGPGAKAQLSSSEVPVLTWKRLISAGGSLKAKSPDPDGLSPLREAGIQEPVGPQAPQDTQVGTDPVPLQTAAAFRSQRRRREVGSPPPQGLGPASAWPW